MGISQKDIKQLWGRSANRCSICKHELAFTEDTADNNVLVGEQAHIVAQKKDGPRGKSNLSADERDSYSNLILLCANHHKIIDDDDVTYSIEKLHHIKQLHESWVKECLSNVVSEQRQAEDEVYAYIIDKTVEALNLCNWEFWSSHAVSSSNMILPVNMVDTSAFEYRIIIKKAVFTDRHAELENALNTLSHIFLATTNIFSEHCKQQNDYYVEDRCYQMEKWNEKEYNCIFNKYQSWKRVFLESFYDMVKTLNWFADVVRRDINPFFFSKEGKFIIVEGDILGFTPNLYVFADSEKEMMPQLIVEKISNINMDAI